MPTGALAVSRADFGRVLERLLGLRGEHEGVKALPASLLGIQTGRFDMQFPAIIDTPEIEKRLDMIRLA